MSDVQQITQLKDFLNKVHPLPDEEWEQMKQRLTFATYPKHTILSKVDNIEKKVYFLLSGAVRVYAVIDAEEYCTNFRFKGEFTSSITSFISQTPSKYELETLTEVEVFELTYEHIQELYARCHHINTLGRKIIEQLYIEKHNRELALLSLSAKERYLDLLKHHPDLIHQIAGKDVASFLGVSPETLSRIRASINAKEEE